jgi:phosphinothricin acetyltransferase
MDPTTGVEPRTHRGPCIGSSTPGVRASHGYRSIVLVRPAQAADAVAIAAIYNEGIVEGDATFEIAPRGPEDVLGWTGEGAPPLLVADNGGEILGWARVASYSDRPAYSGVGQYAVYVTGSARGRGIGRELVLALAAEAERRGYHKLVSRIFPENEASLGLARACGFRKVGVYRNHGRLNGSWRDAVVVERLLGEAAGG